MIDFENVSCAYAMPSGLKRQVVEGLTTRINRGEMVYLIGPTGSGKSTILRLIYMDLFPDVGRVRVGPFRSEDIKANDIPFLRRSLGVVFQDFQLLPDRTVYDNVAFALHATGKKGKVIKERVMSVLGRVGLTHKVRRYPHELSGGEQQRVAVARALANDPRILLADEPTGNLDPAVADEIQKLLVSLHHQGMTVFMATHDYALVKRYPARTLALSHGRLIEVDPASLPG